MKFEKNNDLALLQCGEAQIMHHKLSIVVVERKVGHTVDLTSSRLVEPVIETESHLSSTFLSIIALKIKLDFHNFYNLFQSFHDDFRETIFSMRFLVPP